MFVNILPQSFFWCFFFSCSGAHPDLHSFPTRRSSDLWGRPENRRLCTAIRLRVPGRFPCGRLGRQSAAAALLSSDRKSTRLNSSHLGISYAVFCLKKKRLSNPSVTLNF